MTRRVLAAIAVELIALHTVDGRVVRVNPDFVTQLIQPPPGGNRQYHERVKCIVRLVDGTSVPLAKSCDEASIFFAPPKPKIVRQPNSGNRENNAQSGGNTPSSPAGPSSGGGSPPGGSTPGGGGGSPGGPPGGGGGGGSVGDANKGHGNDPGHHDNDNPGKGKGHNK